uniref:Uncharacterized protein n=1 Tax=Leersia perrieri TaxID=77586 RepID=A0A0D9X9K0_9ORYZ
MELMANLVEVNTDGVRCSRLINQLQRRLPCLERLRVINPVYEAETSSSTDINDLFVGKTDLQLLDLSGNKEMKKLPTSISKASNLKVLILDGCDALEDVVVPNRLPSSLRSFSFDGYGPADQPSSRASTTDELPPQNCRPKHPPAEDTKKNVKTSVISLEGCTQLKILFLRGMPNLVELDLSGCEIKVLDFGTMVTDVPSLKRLFLLGYTWMCSPARPSLAVEHRFKFQLHARIVDARLARSLLGAINTFYSGHVYFNISITSTTSSSSRHVQEETKGNKMTGSSDQQQQQYYLYNGVAASNIYGDVFSKVGDALTTQMQQAFPQPPTVQLDRHVEIGDGSRNVESEVQASSESKNLDCDNDATAAATTALTQICEGFKMVAPELETIRIRGCWSLRRLPALKGRTPGKEKPSVEVEKDVWDALEWDGVEAGHCPSLFQPPRHSRYYKNKRLPRGSLLRYLLD